MIVSFFQSTRTDQNSSTKFYCRKPSKKLKGDPLRKTFFSKRSLTMSKKKLKGDPLVSPGIVCYAEKIEKCFWFSSLCQMVHFDTVKFRSPPFNFFGTARFFFGNFFPKASPLQFFCCFASEWMLENPKRSLLSVFSAL